MKTFGELAMDGEISCCNIFNDFFDMTGHNATIFRVVDELGEKKDIIYDELDDEERLDLISIAKGFDLTVEVLDVDWKFKMVCFDHSFCLTFFSLFLQAWERVSIVDNGLFPTLILPVRRHENPAYPRLTMPEVVQKYLKTCDDSGKVFFRYHGNSYVVGDNQEEKVYDEEIENLPQISVDVLELRAPRNENTKLVCFSLPKYRELKKKIFVVSGESWSTVRDLGTLQRSMFSLSS